MILLPILTVGISAFLFWRKKIEKHVCFFMVCGSILGLILMIREEGLEKEREITFLERSEVGEGEKEVELNVQTEEGEKAEVVVQVPEKQYDSMQIEKILKDQLKKMDTRILGENESFERVEHNLDLPVSFEDSPITIEWSTDLPEVLNWDGTIGEAAENTGTEVCLEGILTLQEQTVDYRRILIVYADADSENLQTKLQKEVAKINKNNNSDDYQLPQKIEGRNITWYEKPDQTGRVLSLLSAVTGGLVILSGRTRKERKTKERQEEMQKDYPELVGKIQLLLGAGISMRKVFERIAADYKKELECNRKAVKRWAYEEIVRTVHEMNSGASEQEAYEKLGMRCEIPSYKGLTILLVQNLNKGGAGMVPLLEQEARTAFEERKRQARTAGEKATVKLLLPMGLMLLVVFILVLVPALLAF